MSSAVKACNDILNMKTPGASTILQVEEDETDRVHALTIQGRESVDNLVKRIQELAKTVAGLQNKNVELQQSQRGGKKPTEKKGNSVCWGCRQEGHKGKIVRHTFGLLEKSQKLDQETRTAHSSKYGY